MSATNPGATAPQASAADEIDIIGLDDMAVTSRSFGNLFGHAKVKTETLQANLQALLDKLGDVLQGLPAEIGNYSLSEMTLAVSVTAKGAVSLLGSGGEVTGQGGITLKLTRKPDAASDAAKPPA